MFSDNNAASTPNPSEINKTPKKSNIKNPSTEGPNIDAAMRSIFDLSCKITNVVTSLYKSESSSNSKI